MHLLEFAITLLLTDGLSSDLDQTESDLDLNLKMILTIKVRYFNLAKIAINLLLIDRLDLFLEKRTLMKKSNSLSFPGI